jgi:hypothetical protein
LSDRREIHGPVLPQQTSGSYVDQVFLFLFVSRSMYAHICVCDLYSTSSTGNCIHIEKPMTACDSNVYLSISDFRFVRQYGEERGRKTITVYSIRIYLVIFFIYSIYLSRMPLELTISRDHSTVYGFCVE